MAEFKTVADFVKVPDVLEQMKNQLQVQSLMQQVQLAPLERTIKTQQALLQDNQISMLAIENDRARMALLKDAIELRKKQGEQFLQVTSNLPQLALQSPEAANAFVVTMFGVGAAVTKTELGTVRVTLPGVPSYETDPEGITDPKERERLRGEWQKNIASLPAAKDFAEADRLRNIAHQLASVGTKEADKAIIAAYAEMINPAAVRREGGQTLISSFESLPSQLELAWKSLSDPNTGAMSDKVRANILEVGDNIYAVKRKSALFEIAGAANLQARSRTGAWNVEPERFVPIVGDITPAMVRAEADRLSPAGKVAPRPDSPAQLMFDELQNNAGGGGLTAPAPSAADVLPPRTMQPGQAPAPRTAPVGQGRRPQTSRSYQIIQPSDGVRAFQSILNDRLGIQRRE